jgi:hypothetical protein
LLLLAEVEEEHQEQQEALAVEATMPDQTVEADLQAEAEEAEA